MNAVNPPVSSCRSRKTEQVLQALLERLDGAVHHRGGRAQTGVVGVAHHAEPFIGGGLAVAVEQLPDAIDEDLSAASGNAVEPGVDQAADHLGHRQAGQPGDVDHLGWRERVQAELGISSLDGAEQVLVPGEGNIGIVSALKQQLVAADGNRLVDLPEDLIEGEDVALAGADRTVERAEVAPRDADVRVVDVAIDDVGDDAPRMLRARTASASRPSTCVGA